MGEVVCYDLISVLSLLLQKLRKQSGANAAADSITS